MLELIDKSIVLKRLCAACYNMGSFACISCVIPKIIKEIPTVRNGKWIPCSERLPEPGDSYITYAKTTKYCTHNEIFDDGRINILYFDGKEWYNDRCIYYNVTHWMPLPKQPEKEESEDD